MIMKISSWTTTTTWSVSFELAPVSGDDSPLPLELQTVKRLLDVLEDRAPVARPEELILQITFNCAGDMTEALRDAKETLESALALAGIKGLDICGANIISHDDFSTRMRAGDRPRYLSVTETAKVLGVSKQRVSQMVRERRGLVPDAFVGDAPAFKEAAVRRFGSARGRAWRTRR